MKWEELDLARRVWTLPKSRTKNAKAHVVHLSEQSIAVLKGSGEGGPGSYSRCWEQNLQRVQSG